MTSANHDARPAGAPIDHLVLHYTGMRSADAAITRLCDPGARVSAHYVIEETGTVHALVAEEARAWHAGVSFWRGIRHLNDRSIGIEIVNPGHEWGYVAFPDEQMAAVAALCQDVIARRAIPQRNVVAHSDIAPDRKQDPGELFDWSWLAARGVGLWTNEIEPSRNDPVSDLAAIGYDISFAAPIVIAAFQRRFRPARVDGALDDDTAGRIGAVRRLMNDVAKI